MNAANAVGLALVILATLYLLYALIRPEKF